jgi:hypothetical protein
MVVGAYLDLKYATVQYAPPRSDSERRGPKGSSRGEKLSDFAAETTDQF